MTRTSPTARAEPDGVRRAGARGRRDEAEVAVASEADWGRRAGNGPGRGAEERRAADHVRVRGPLRGDAARPSALAARARELDTRERRRSARRSSTRSTTTAISPTTWIPSARRLRPDVVAHGRGSGAACSSRSCNSFDPVGVGARSRQRVRAAAARAARRPTRPASRSRAAIAPEHLELGRRAASTSRSSACSRCPTRSSRSRSRSCASCHPRPGRRCPCARGRVRGTGRVRAPQATATGSSS